MTRFSETLLPTPKDPPADAEALSHKLMVRAGLIRQLGAGLWTYLPAGWRAHRKVEGIIREEMEGIGCQEMLMPVLQPAEPWEKTGRYGIEEMFKLSDRKGSPLVLAGDLAPGGAPIEIEPAIEVGNIFKLGTRYSEPLGATYLDESGTEQPIVMGSYGIGPARIVAAAIEQGADERGIVWPPAIAPWQVHLVGLGKPGDDVTEAAERLYGELTEAGVEVVYDDRDAGPGRSSPTPSCSAARCASPSAGGRWRRARSRLRGGPTAPIPGSPSSRRPPRPRR